MKKLLAILILWLPFSLFALLAIPLFLYGIVAEDETIWRPIGRAMDKLMATVLGFSGFYTLSAELGAGTKYQLLRRFLDAIQKDHCRIAAIDERLLP